jgi:hypothetical protein
VLLGFGAPSQLRLLAGQEHGRTIPLLDVAPSHWYPAIHRSTLSIVHSINGISGTGRETLGGGRSGHCHPHLQPYQG